MLVVLRGLSNAGSTLQMYKLRLHLHSVLNVKLFDTLLQRIRSLRTERLMIFGGSSALLHPV